MGYTRYWERTDKELTEDFIEEVKEVLEDCKEKGIIIRNGVGEGEPVVSLKGIYLNGNAETDLDHETFYIDNNPSKFEFCKTARKPYDYAVRKILEIAESYGIVTDVSDDGENEEIISDEVYLNGGESSDIGQQLEILRAAIKTPNTQVYISDDMFTIEIDGTVWSNLLSYDEADIQIGCLNKGYELEDIPKF